MRSSENASKLAKPKGSLEKGFHREENGDILINGDNDDRS